MKAALLILNIFFLYNLSFAEYNTYSGYYKVGFEQSSFKPFNVDEEWWLIDKTKSLRAKGSGHIKVRGFVSDKGPHGHMGTYVRTITVIDILAYDTINSSKTVDGEKSKISKDGTVLAR